MVEGMACIVTSTTDVTAGAVAAVSYDPDGVVVEVTSDSMAVVLFGGIVGEIIGTVCASTRDRATSCISLFIVCLVV